MVFGRRCLQEQRLAAGFVIRAAQRGAPGRRQGDAPVRRLGGESRGPA
ncbi:MAG: hypothetical protein OXU61_10130 [Gammaproteobacteria bacterium]|nr:hypothetical protein [Gammaproteobacteria bacterium]